MSAFRRLVCLSFLSVGLSLQPAVVRAQEPATHSPEPMVSFDNGVRSFPGQVYQHLTGYRPGQLDVYVPPASSKRPAAGFPLVLFIHDGAWQAGDMRHSGNFKNLPGVLAALSARGYVVASVDYRLSAEAKFPAQIQDVKTALRWLREQARRFGINPTRAMAWGISAGGHLAALTAVSCQATVLNPNEQSNISHFDSMADCVQGAVAWDGVFDLATLAGQTAALGLPLHKPERQDPVASMLGCEPGPACAQKTDAASPVTYMHASVPPMLLIAGANNTAIPYEQTREMADRLRSAGIRHEVHFLSDAGFRFQSKTPAHTQRITKSALDTTFRFIDHTIGPDAPPL